MTNRRHISCLIAALALTFPGSGAESAEGDAHAGRVEIVDGDTLTVSGAPARIRLFGIDAPEGRQKCQDATGAAYLCGTRAAEHLHRLVGRNGRLSCVEVNRDRYDRIVAECFRPDGVNINAAMVADGWAVDYTQYSNGRYSGQEAAARQAERGIWSGRFTRPADWRRGKRLPAQADAGTIRGG